MTEKQKEGEQSGEKAVAFVFSPAVAELFHQRRLSLLATTYQAQRVLLFSAPSRDRMDMLMRVFPRPTGIALHSRRLALACKYCVWIFEVATDLRNLKGETLPYDLVYVPRCCHITGDIAAHQLGWIDDQLYFINTSFSCVSRLAEQWSFVPDWRPAFISKLAPDDRCHLNGFCSDGRAWRYATALGATDSEEGWRSAALQGGVVIDMTANRVVAGGLCLPHNPVWHAGQLWLLESGRGALLRLDPQGGQAVTVAHLPGFLRGLAFYERWAFVGLCQARDNALLGALPVQEDFGELHCGIYVVDIRSGTVAGIIQFTKGVEELFDVQLLVGPRAPHLIGLEDDAIENILILPPDLP